MLTYKNLKESDPLLRLMTLMPTDSYSFVETDLPYKTFYGRFTHRASLLWPKVYRLIPVSDAKAVVVCLPTPEQELLIYGNEPTSHTRLTRNKNKSYGNLSEERRPIERAGRV